MKTLLPIVFFVALFPAFAAKAQTASESDYGIAASNSKDVLFVDLKTKEVTNLTADLKGILVDGPFAVSENGKILVWTQNQKLWMKRLPSGKPQTLKIENFGKIAAGKEKEEITVLPDLKNLRASLQGDKISFEFSKPGQSFVLVPPGSKIDQTWMLRWGSNKSDPTPYKNYPLFDIKTEACNGVRVLSVSSSYSAAKVAEFGNTAEFPPVCPYRFVPSAILPQVTPLVAFYTSMHDYGQGLVLLPKDAIARYSIRRDAHFCVISKNPDPKKQLMAVIYQTANGWGPIEIREQRQVSALGSLKGDNRNLKPGIYELSILLRDCQCMDWNPEDGSLWILSQNTLLSIDGAKIAQGIENSGIAENPNKSNRIPIPVRNVLAIEPTVIAQNIETGKFCCVSKNAFVFRAKDSSGKSPLCLWDKGTVRTLIANVPREFFLCKSPIQEFSNEKAQKPYEVASSDDKAGQQNFLSGKSRVPSVNSQKNSSVFFEVGSIRTCWIQQGDRDVLIRVSGFVDQDDLAFAVLSNATLEDIKDPSKYKFEKRPAPNEKINKTEVGTRSLHARVEIGDLILLVSGNTCAAIKPKALIPKYKSWEELPKGTFITSKPDTMGKGPVPIFEEMDIEWRFWPELDENSPIEVDIRESIKGKGRAVAGREKEIGCNQDRLSGVHGKLYYLMDELKTDWSANSAGYVGLSLKLNGQNNLEYSPLPLARLSSADLKRISASLRRAGDTIKMKRSKSISVSSVKDPSLYDYKKSDADEIAVYLDQGICLKLNDKYLAFRPTKIERLFSHWDEVPKEMLSRGLPEGYKNDPEKYFKYFKAMGIVSEPTFYEVEYEWKCWPGKNGIVRAKEKTEPEALEANEEVEATSPPAKKLGTAARKAATVIE